eukprot:COSAG04_NODE_797_length_10240_cov_3.294547_3_plen_661_part_00
MLALPRDAVGANDPMGKIVLPLSEILAGTFESSKGLPPPAEDKAAAEGTDEKADNEKEGADKDQAAEGESDKQESEDKDKDMKKDKKSKKRGKKEKPERPVLDSRGISDPEGLWLPLRPLVGAGDDNADQRNELLITVMRASGLQVMDKALFGKGSSDPFVEVRCGDEKVKSSTKKKTLSPDWNGEELSVPMLESADSSSELVLTVFDWDRVGGNDFMGRTTVTLGELLQEAVAEGDLSDDSDLEAEESEGDKQPVVVPRDGGGRRRKVVLMSEDGMEDEESRGQLTFAVRWVHNKKLAEARLAALADVQGEVLIRVESERLPQTAAEAASQQGMLLDLLDKKGPTWPAEVAVMCSLPPPVTTCVEVVVRFATQSGTAVGGTAFLENEDTLFFALGPHRPTQTLTATTKLLHDPLRFDPTFDAKGDEHLYLRLVGAKVLAVRGGSGPAPHPPIAISEGRRTCTLVIEDKPEGSRPKLGEEDLGLKIARRAAVGWKPFGGGEFVCSLCGRCARDNLDGVLWPECIAEHGPPFEYFERPRVDPLHHSPLAALEVRRHQIAWLSRPVLALHKEEKAARRRSKQMLRVVEKARRQAVGGGERRRLEVASVRAEQRRRKKELAWDATPIGTRPAPREGRRNRGRSREGMRVATSLPNLPELRAGR